MREPPRSHRDLEVYKHALAAYILDVRLTSGFPAFERYELIVQTRAAARSVCSCIAEAWRKRNYPAAFASKLTDAESEAAETQTWADIALVHGYITPEESEMVINAYEQVLGQLVKLRLTAHKWKVQ